MSLDYYYRRVVHNVHHAHYERPQGRNIRQPEGRMYTLSRNRTKNGF